MSTSENINSNEFYKKLRNQLYETTEWPSEYLYKFIVTSNPEKILKIERLFDNLGAVIRTIESKKGTYTSISVNLLMKNPEEVILKYKEVANSVEDVIAL